METEERAVFAKESGSPAHNPDPVPVDPENTGSAAPGSSGSSGNTGSGTGNSDSIENDSGTQTGSPSSNNSGSSGSHSSGGGSGSHNTFIELTEEDQAQTEPAEETDSPESEIVEITIFEGFREPTLPAEEIPQSGGTGGSAGWLLAGIGIVLVLVIGLVLARKKK